MIEYIKASKEKLALVCDKVDRLQRSFKEVPILEELRTSDKLEIHFIQEFQVLDKNANASQLLAYSFYVMMANNYTNQISDNVKRSNERKLKQGEVLGQAPLEYSNYRDENDNSAVKLDTERAYLIKRCLMSIQQGFIHCLK